MISCGSLKRLKRSIRGLIGLIVLIAIHREYFYIFSTYIKIFFSVKERCGRNLG